MKKSIYLLAVAALGLAIQPAAFSDETTPNDQIRVQVPVKALLTPEYGFETKNNIQVVLYGALPNSCYSVGESVVTKQPDGHSFLITQYANKGTSGVCAESAAMPEHMQMMVPFTQEVSIGHLDPGTYQFLYNVEHSATPLIRMMTVSPNVTPTVDSLPYAATSLAYAPDVISGNDPVVVTISGVLNSTCTSLNDEVKVLNENDVFVLFPTVTVHPGVVCAQVMIPFQKEVNLGKTFPGIHLIHVRSMNGKSVNKVVVVTK